MFAKSSMQSPFSSLVSPVGTAPEIFKLQCTIIEFEDFFIMGSDPIVRNGEEA